MTLSDSEDDKKHKGFKIGSSGTPVNWNGDDWTFYKHAMLNAFEKSLLDEIATGAPTEDATWHQDKKDAFKKKQAKIKILIQGSLSMKLAKQVMSKKTGTEMWQELCTIYEGKKNPAMTAQKVYRLQGELHRTRLRTNGDVRNHLYKLFELKDRLEDLKSPVNDLQMVDLMLRSLPTQTCYNELRRKVFFSSNMSKYTPEMVREMILTADSRSKDWENSAFGKSQDKKKPGSAAGAQKGVRKQTLSDESKKKTASTDFSCHHCGGKGHYKRNYPDLLGEEKPSGRKNALAKYARSGVKPADTETVDTAADENDRTLKRKVVVGEAVKWATTSYDPSQWYFDTGTNAHIVASKEYFTVLQSMKDSDWNPTISGFADGVGAQAEGFGTILLATMIDEEMMFVFVEDVLYVPGAGCNLFSPGLAMDQGFTMLLDQDSRIFGMAKDSIEVIRTTHEHRLWTFNAHNINVVTDGVEDIEVWHERLAHTCPQYIRLMVDRGMAKGIMLKKPGKVECADCHFGKQRRKTYRKKIDR
ncbi:hypothetical protein PF005_g11108 [Phytophthora fragariae]|uniref:Uncharacterized protein n=1 Tax=Phytophthora fragariae TaxID=53985 RepID=A0A6A3TTM9_9STRA|nr:hypothetical protein PF003_g12111 [Phytophthora fragariae]KAE8937329.1 hypothetical protein PF009_g12761 [Phytophthora fragariae]KAE9004060.1 hypothetical protein PF011_g12628 [Phytophthora fragariae]KAE9110632.1 hypothetical protein PF007_g11791 [Phytophthora fragariae]KAE9142400.1 hypothetical protein PF006_g12476 [Phytophthora fragariae]